MVTLITVIHVFVGFVLIFVVLLQTGKGAAMGSAFGGSSQTVFGTSGAGNFLTKFTTGAAIAFMITSLTLSAMSSSKEKASVVTSGQTAAQQQPKAALPKIPSETKEAGTAARSSAKSPTGEEASSGTETKEGTVQESSPATENPAAVDQPAN